MAEQQPLQDWEQKYVNGELTAEEIRLKMGEPHTMARLQELAQQYGELNEEGEAAVGQFSAPDASGVAGQEAFQANMQNQASTQGTDLADTFDKDTASMDSWDNPFEAVARGFARNVGGPLLKTGMAIGDKASDTFGAFNKREGKLGLGMGEGTENAAMTGLGLVGVGKGAGAATGAASKAGIGGYIPKALSAIKNVFSKSAPATGGAAKGAAPKVAPHLVPGAASKVPGLAKTVPAASTGPAAAKAAAAFDDPAAKAVAATAAKTGTKEVAKKGVKEGAEEVVEKGGKEAAKKAGPLSKAVNLGKGGLMAGGAISGGKALWDMSTGGDEEKPPEATAEEHPDYQEETPGTVTKPIPMAPGATAPAAPGAAPGVVVPGSPPAHNVARAQQLEDAARLAKEGRLPPRPIQDSHRTKAHGRAWEEQVKKRGDRLREEDTIVAANDSRMRDIYNSTGGRTGPTGARGEAGPTGDPGAWDSLDMAGKKQAIRNFNINQGNARDRSGKLDNIMKEATNRWIDGGRKGPQPSAGFVEPEVMDRQVFDEEGFMIPHVGFTSPSGEKPFFDQDRGGMTPEAFTDLTGLGRKGTGLSQNADGSWNTIESDGAFDRAGGMDSAKDYLLGNEPQDSGVTPQAPAPGVQDALPPQDPFPETEVDPLEKYFEGDPVATAPAPGAQRDIREDFFEGDPVSSAPVEQVAPDGQPQDFGQDSQSTIPGGSPAPVDQPPAQPSTIPAPPQDNFELPEWDGVSPLPNPAATDSSAVGWNPGGNMAPGREQALKDQMQTAEQEDLLNQGSPVEGLPDPGAQRDVREDYFQGSPVEGLPDPGAQPSEEQALKEQMQTAEKEDLLNSNPSGSMVDPGAQPSAELPEWDGVGPLPGEMPETEVEPMPQQPLGGRAGYDVNPYGLMPWDPIGNQGDQPPELNAGVETGEMSSSNEVAPTQAPEELTAPSTANLNPFDITSSLYAPARTAAQFLTKNPNAGVPPQTPQTPQAPQTPPHANNYPPYPGVEGGDAMYAALENFGPGSGEYKDHPSGVGRYTDQFGQQSKLNKGTVRLSPNAQEYGDATFRSKADALGMVNRRKSFDQPTPEPQPQPQTPPVPPALPMSPTTPPAGVPAPKMPGPGALMITAAAIALAKKMGINPQAAAKILNRGKTAIGVKSAQATKALPRRAPTPGPAVSSPGTRLPPGRPLRTAAPGGGTPAGPRVVTPKPPVVAPASRTPSAPQQQYVPRTGNPVTTAPTSRLPGGAGSRQRFDDPSKTLRERQFQLAHN